MDKKGLLIGISFFIIYVVWGSTYLVLTYVIEEIPPYLTAFLRFFIAAIILLLISLAFRQFKDIDIRKVKNSMLAGTMMLGIGSGVTSWVLQYLDSGFTALLISAQPLLVVFMMWISDKKKPSSQVFFGVALGIIGIYLLVSQNGILADPDQWFAILAIVGCLFSWGIGRFFISKADMPKSFLVNTFIQFTSGSLFTLIMSFMFDDLSNVNLFNLSEFTYYAMLYLAIFGSVVAFLSFTFLLKNVTPDKVSTATYVNPIIALLLGWWFRDELVTIQSLIAALIMLTGVVLINFKLKAVRKSLYYRLPKRKRNV
ncbi:MAG: EamA family transporter [Saprospiraceae bacterium]|nr:EamA family transporter [Saprospiraceae bacterium]